MRGQDFSNDRVRVGRLSRARMIAVAPADSGMLVAPAYRSLSPK